MNNRRFTASLHSALFLTGIALVATLGFTPAARADAYTFSITPNPLAGDVADGSVSNINASGVLTVSNTPINGVYSVTGISGTYSDSANGISGTISGLEPQPLASVISSDLAAGTFAPPGSTPAHFSYDDIFWAGGNSSAVCADAPIFYGGDFDIYGLAFDVAQGADNFTVDLWSNGALGGYQVNDSVKGSTTPFSPNADHQIAAYGVNFSASPTPEPASLLLVGSSLSGLAALWRRKKLAA